MYYRQLKEAATHEKGAQVQNTPIYATFPVVKMGQMTLYDQHAAICLDGGRPPYDLEDVDDVFAGECSGLCSLALFSPFN